MDMNKDVQQGWDFALKILGADISPDTGQEYISAVEDTIIQLEYDADRDAETDMPSRVKIAKAYAETEALLTGTLKNTDDVGLESIEIRGAEQIAAEGKDPALDSKQYGTGAANSVKTQYLLKQALQAGYTTAAISMVFQLASEIYKALDYLVKNGKIDIRQLKQPGMNVITAGAEGFLRGHVASTLLIMCEKGALGQAFKSINPKLLGVMVALVVQTLKNSILLAAGTISPQEMGAAFTDMVIVSGGYLVGSYIGGIIGQAIGFELPVIGYLLGSLIGTSFCVIYNIGKKKLISFCVDTGFTCFGLVEQNYELPEEVLKELNIDIIPVPRTQIERTEIPRADTCHTEIDKTNYETIRITVLRRGIIGVNKIGYVTT